MKADKWTMRTYVERAREVAKKVYFSLNRRIVFLDILRVID